MVFVPITSKNLMIHHQTTFEAERITMNQKVRVFLSEIAVYHPSKTQIFHHQTMLVAECFKTNHTLRTTACHP